MISSVYTLGHLGSSGEYSQVLNEQARLTIVTIVKRASSFNRDLRVIKIKH